LPKKQARTEKIVAVRKNIRLHANSVAQAALDGKFAAVQLGFHRFNHDAA
jgi:hypothetical protein